MAKQTRAQKKTIARVMHEYKHGELQKSKGGKVKDPRQAIAIALREAGTSNHQSPVKNRRQYARTKAKERRGQTAQQEKEGSRAMNGKAATSRPRRSSDRTRAQLCTEARRRKMPGRSRMNKTQLQHAMGR